MSCHNPRSDIIMFNVHSEIDISISALYICNKGANNYQCTMEYGIQLSSTIPNFYICEIKLISKGTLQGVPKKRFLRRCVIFNPKIVTIGSGIDQNK